MIEEADADFVCLQEVVGRFFKVLFKSKKICERYFISTNGIRGYGICILSKFPMRFTETNFHSSMGRSLLVGETFINGEPFFVATSHLESMDTADT